MQIHITDTINPKFGGQGAAAYGLSRGLSNHNTSVTLVTKEIINCELSPNKKNYKIILLKKNFFCIQIFNDFFALNSILKDKKPDIVHLHGLWTVFISMAALICIFQKIKFIISPHGCLEDWALKHKWFKKKMAMMFYQKFILQKANCVVVNSKIEVISAQSTRFIKNIALIQNGISKFPKKYNSFEKYSSRLTSKKNILLFFSRVHEKKGIDYLLEAWRISDTKNWHLKIVGPGEPQYVKFLKNLIKKNNLQKSVTLKGSFVSNEVKHNLFKSSDAFILPTKSENFGIVVLEALSYQIPVITTKEAPWEELSLYKCGWWVESNPNAISLAITNLIKTSNKELYYMGSKGYDLVKDKYSWISKGKEAKQLNDWILKRNRTKPSFVF